jgi:hypothetical protein
MWEILDLERIASGLRLSTPLILAALGCLFCERAGVVNIALDGIMIFGVFSGAVIAYETSNPWFGLLGAVIIGGLIAHIHGIASIRYTEHHRIEDPDSIRHCRHLTRLTHRFRRSQRHNLWTGLPSTPRSDNCPGSIAWSADTRETQYMAPPSHWDIAPSVPPPAQASIHRF